MSVDNFLSQALTVITILAIVVVVLLAYVTTKSNGSLTKAVSRVVESESINGIVMVVVAFIVAGLFIGTVLYGERAEGAESKVDYLEYTYIFAGVDYEMFTNIFCEKGDVNGKLVSNVGLGQHLVSINDINIEAKYQHHSCALNRDKPTYDAIGLNMEWRFNWK